MAEGEEQLSPEQVAQLKEKLKSMSPEQIKELQKQNCIFCQIISGKIPAKTIYQDDKCIAFLDIYPANPGHVLLVPKEHYSIMPQIPEQLLQHTFIVAKHISHAILRGLKASGVNIFVANGAIAGQRAPHFMIHLIPRKEEDGLKFDLPQKDLPKELKEKIVSLFKEPKQETSKPSQKTEEIVEKPGEETEIELKEEKRQTTTIEQKQPTPDAEFTEQIEILEKELKGKKENKKQKPAPKEKKQTSKKSTDTPTNLDDIARLFS